MIALHDPITYYRRALNSIRRVIRCRARVWVVQANDKLSEYYSSSNERDANYTLTIIRKFISNMSEQMYAAFANKASGNLQFARFVYIPAVGVRFTRMKEWESL